MSGQLTVLLLLTAPLFATGDDEDLLQGLRARRLFHLAETHCQSRLSEQELPLAERTVLTVELIRVYAEQALNAAAANREQAWSKARETAEAFLSEHAAAPNSILVQVQDALTLLARGELARMESEVNANRETALADARQVLRQAATGLQTIDRQLIDLVPRQDRSPGRAGELSSQQLASLQHNVRFHLARGYRNQALCYDAGSPDRTASLTQALEQLKQPLLQLAPDEPLAVDVRLQQIECLRLLGDVKVGEQYLSSFSTIELPPDKQLLVRAEAIRLRLAGGQSPAALVLIAEGRRIASVASPELDFAFLETYASLWKEAADSQDAANRDRWRDKAITTAKFIEQTHGGYWGRRGELLLVRIGQGSGDGSLEILRRTADDLFRKGQFGDAMVAYERAAQTASKAGDSQHAFEFAYKAALVQQSTKAYEAASRQFRKLAFDNKSHPHAANAHLLAIANARQASAVGGAWLPEYVELLREHLQHWPGDSQTVDPAAFWLGEFESAAANWSAAIDAFRQVSPASPNDAAAVQALGNCWRQKLKELSDSPAAVAEEAGEASAFFESLIHDEQGDLPGEWSEVQRHAVLAAAEIRLNYAAENLSGTEQMLKSALSGDPMPTPAWRTSASALLLVTIARQGGREAEALEFARQLGNASTDQLLDLFAQIGQTVAAASDSAKPALANLRLEVGKLLEAKLPELNDDQRRSFRVQQAGALANAGRKEEALSAYGLLAKEFPDDGALQEAYANELLDSDEASTLQEALNQWRRVAAKSRPRTALWFKAKYSVALAQHKLGDHAGAAKLIRYLQATEDLEQSGLQREFQQLLDRCEK